MYPDEVKLVSGVKLQILNLMSVVGSTILYFLTFNTKEKIRTDLDFTCWAFVLLDIIKGG